MNNKFLNIFILFLSLIISGFVVSLSQQNLEGIPQSFDPEYKRTGDYTYYTLDKILSTFYDEKNFNRKVSAVGYISRDTTFRLKEGELLLQRVFVTCCLSHARSVSIYLLVDNPPDFKDNEWVKVNGPVIGVTNQFGINPAIKAERIERIPEPQNPYLNCNACPAQH